MVRVLWQGTRRGARGKRKACCLPFTIDERRADAIAGFREGGRPGGGQWLAGTGKARRSAPVAVRSGAVD
jgi:hypothetical protein